MSHNRKPSLQDQNVVIVDCQTTGPTPEKGQLLELAWSLGGEVNSCVVTLPEGEVVPRQVERITGIGEADLEGAFTLEEVSRQFAAYLSELGTDEVIVVAHYARFEKRFLEHLVSSFEASCPKMKFVCTYELARRLVPDLPKHSLRAVSGFLGHRLPEKRRAADHVRATVVIWEALTEQYLKDAGSGDVSGLVEYLKTPPPPRPKKKRYALPKSQRDGLPSKPGVYRFLDVDGDELYIGKATNLKQRVSSYFTHAKGKASHILEMLSGAHNLTFKETQTSLEAALMEADAIKEINPPYNKSLRIEDPRMWYFTQGLEEASEQWSPEFCVGPFPRMMPVDALKSLHGFVTGSFQSEDVTELVEPFEDVLDIETLHAGIGVFARHFLGRSSGETTLGRLISAGLILNHRDKVVSSDKEQEVEDVVEDEIGEETRWDASKVVRYCEGIVSMAARYWQRGVWYKMLGNGTVGWAANNQNEGDLKRQLELDNCQIVDVCYLNDGDDKQRVTRSSEGPMNRTQYDRMRVLTMEIRRIVPLERDMEVRLRGQVLRGERLAEILMGV